MQKLNNRPQIPAASEGPAGCVSQAGDGFSILVRMLPSRATQKPVGIPTLPVFFACQLAPTTQHTDFPLSQGQLWVRLELGATPTISPG